MWLQEHILIVTPIEFIDWLARFPYASSNVGYIHNVYSERHMNAGREACMGSYYTSKCYFGASLSKPRIQE